MGHSSTKMEALKTNSENSATVQGELMRSGAIVVFNISNHQGNINQNPKEFK